MLEECCKVFSQLVNGNLSESVLSPFTLRLFLLFFPNQKTKYTHRSGIELATCPAEDAAMFILELDRSAKRFPSNVTSVSMVQVLNA